MRPRTLPQVRASAMISRPTRRRRSRPDDASGTLDGLERRSRRRLDRRPAGARSRGGPRPPDAHRRLGPAHLLVGAIPADQSPAEAALPAAASAAARAAGRPPSRTAGVGLPALRVPLTRGTATLGREGASSSLPTALGILAATGAVAAGRVGSFAVVGELALAGQLRP